jgi:hypothetical protein
LARQVPFGWPGDGREHDLGARLAASPEQWWGTPRYRDGMAVGDRVWVQVTGPP